MAASLQFEMSQSSGFPFPIPFLEHLGMVLVSYGENQAQIDLPLQAWMHNSYGVGHGGVVMTLLDVAMALSGRTESDSANTGNVTIEMKTTFFAPARGSVLKAHGSCLKRTGRMVFCEAELFDDAGQLLAKSSGTFRRTAVPKLESERHARAE
jgi:uncharacterized protein (TIGR00369 family)